MDEITINITLLDRPYRLSVARAVCHFRRQNGFRVDLPQSELGTQTARPERLTERTSIIHASAWTFFERLELSVQRIW